MAPRAEGEADAAGRAASPVRKERGGSGRPGRGKRSRALSPELSPGEREWNPLVEGFVSSRSFRDPEEVIDVMLHVLARVRSWADFVSGGFLFLAPLEVKGHFRYGAGRTFQLFEGFVRWMHAQDEITDWQRDVLLFEIATQRYCHRVRPERPPGVMELSLPDHQIPKIARELAPTFEDPVLADEGMVISALRCLQGHLEMHLGPSQWPPVGSLDPHQLIRDSTSFAQTRAHHESNRALFATLARFYDWAGKTERLQGKRAAEIAAVLAMAAAPMGVPSGMVS